MILIESRWIFSILKNRSCFGYKGTSQMSRIIYKIRDTESRHSCGDMIDEIIEVNSGL